MRGSLNGGKPQMHYPHLHQNTSIRFMFPVRVGDVSIEDVEVGNLYTFVGFPNLGENH